MEKGRLEAFSDGVLAIIITIMVLEIKVPVGHDLTALKPVLPKLLSYLLSFVYIGIYWNNHHHLMKLVKHINGNTLWANTNLLFWLSLFPFATDWIGETHFALWPVVLYGIELIMASISYAILVVNLKKVNGSDSAFSKAIGNDSKGLISTACYALGIAGCFITPWVGLVFYTVVACIWFIPDKRIEKVLYADGEINTDD